MKIKYFILLVIIKLMLSSYLFALTEPTSDKYRIAKIKYLTPNVLSENVMRTFLGFREGQSFKERHLNFLISLAETRLRNYGVFYRVNIFAKDSEKLQGEKIVYIELVDGWRDIYGGNTWYGMWGRNNFLHRGDHIGFFTGINKNVFNMKSHLPPGWLSISHSTGWQWKMDVPFFPFFPLYGGTEQQYIHHIFSRVKLNFKVHPDIKLGFYSGVLVNLINPLSTLDNYVEPALEYKRTGFPMGMYLDIDQRDLRDKYMFGYRFLASGGVNLDVLNISTFEKLNSELFLYFFPNKFVNFIHKVRLYNQFFNTQDYLKFNINNIDYQRGMVLNDVPGDLLFVTNFDFIVMFYEFFAGFGSMAIGSHFFYDGFFLTQNDIILLHGLSGITFNHTVGGGFWMRFGPPVNLTFFLNFGYTVRHEWMISLNVVFGRL